MKRKYLLRDDSHIPAIYLHRGASGGILTTIHSGDAVPFDSMEDVDGFIKDNETKFKEAHCSRLELITIYQTD